MMALPACPVARCAMRAVQHVLDDYRVPVSAFDTETTGFRGVVIQAALVTMDAHGRVMETVSGIIPPATGYALEPGAVKVHGIDEARIAREGQPAVEFLRAFVRRLERAHKESVVVAHNKEFDVARLNQTLAAHGLPAIDTDVTDAIVCTMSRSKQYCGLKNKRGAPRYAKNEELYGILTRGDASSEFGSLHDACTDAMVTARSYLAGRRLGWWQ